MINKITISGVASYKNEATLETDKNINLIYGINGSGKSTFSEYLRKGPMQNIQNALLSQ